MLELFVPKCYCEVIVKKGFALPLILLVISIIIVLLVLVLKFDPIGVWRYHSSPNYALNDYGSIDIKKDITRLSEGNQTIKMNAQTDLLLPTGSLVTLSDHGPYFFFNQSETKNFQDGLIVDKLLKVYNKGYTYQLENKGCVKEEVTRTDYNTIVDKECTVYITIAKSAAIKSNYNGFSKKFSSQITDRYNTPIVSDQNELFLTIVTPYTQLYRNSGSQQYEFTSPRGDTVTIYSNYGKSRFAFNKEDLNNNGSKTEKIGPLTITVKVEALKCYPPYLDQSGGCNASKSSPVYNKVDFVLNIVEDKTNQEEPKILDYRW